MPWTTDNLAEHHARLLAHLPDEVTYSGAAYACNRISMRAAELEARRADLSEDYSLSLAVAAADFLTAPSRGETVTYDGVTYRVLAIDESPDQVELRLHLGAEHTRRLR